MPKSNAERQAAHRARREEEATQRAGDLQMMLMIGARIGRERPDAWENWAELFGAAVEYFERRELEPDASAWQHAERTRLLRFCRTGREQWAAFYAIKPGSVA